ncbi:Zinc finger protein 559 [Frankliniella fusca]|uniref:Zinc finger protein 559 n=1 Tax=Frankliniella fusca TaxID=407009 RepID=A0AAE1HFR6_9NEOP|nr:Zinc finger protein 559 [Frankliniella fusca]
MEQRRYLLCVHCFPYQYLPSVAHLNIHLRSRHSDQTLLSCGECKHKFQSVRSVIRHINSQHLESNDQNIAENSSTSSSVHETLRTAEVVDEKEYFCCIHCTPHIYLSTLREFKSHFQMCHDGLISVSCGLCRKLFLHKNSLIRHIERHIAEENGNMGGASQNSANDHDTAHSDTDSNDADGNQAEEGHQNAELNQTEYEINFQEEAANFLLKLRSSGNMTNTSIQTIIENVCTLLSNIMLKAQVSTKRFLNSCNVPPDDAEEFLKSEIFKPSNIFEGLLSTEGQLNYYCSKFGLVIPEELYLDSRIENRFNRSLRMFIATQVSETFQSVSLIDTLTLIVRNDYIRELILSERHSEDGVYRSYKDGTDFANNPFLQKHPFALRLVLYYDGLEIANALGSKDVIHSLGCFYFSIQNLPPSESSLLSAIFLVALCYAQDLKKPGAYGKVLAKFIAELKLLQTDEGVTIDLCNGEKFIIRACLCTLTADTLAALELLGFFTSSAAAMFCRVCMVSKQNLKEDTTAIGALRTSALHEEHVREVERRTASASLYGVKERSALSKVMRVPEDNVFDVFHDMVGVIQMVVKLVLYEFIMVRKLFSVKLFNSNINSFLYGKPDVKNKPSATFTRERLSSAGHTLKQYGSQTFCLLRVFPFIITNVDENDKYLKLIFQLQDILKIVFSFEVKERDICRLEALLYQFGSQFHQIFISPTPAPENVDNEGTISDDNDASEEDGENDEENEEEDVDDARPNRVGKQWKSRKLKKAINKMHHIMHYPQQIREKGPIIRLWCARYEGRHRIIRKHSAVQCNFKNPPKTMARMFQLSTLSAFLARSSPHAYDVKLSGAVSVQVKHSKYKEILVDEGLPEDSFVSIADSAEVCGEEFQSGLFVTLKQDESIQPLFAVIVDVIASLEEQTRVFLVVHKCVSTTFTATYNAYQITNEFEEDHIAVNLENLADHRPIAAWNPLDKLNNMELYLSPRTHYLICLFFYKLVF